MQYFYILCLYVLFYSIIYSIIYSNIYVHKCELSPIHWLFLVTDQDFYLYTSRSITIIYLRASLLGLKLRLFPRLKIQDSLEYAGDPEKLCCSLIHILWWTEKVDLSKTELLVKAEEFCKEYWIFSSRGRICQSGRIISLYLLITSWLMSDKISTILRICDGQGFIHFILNLFSDFNDSNCQWNFVLRGPLIYLTPTFAFILREGRGKKRGWRFSTYCQQLHLSLLF